MKVTTLVITIACIIGFICAIIFAVLMVKGVNNFGTLEGDKYFMFLLILFIYGYAALRWANNYFYI